MNSSQIKAIKFEVQQVGKKIKGTKRRYLWVLSIGQRVYNFILDDSLLSGRSKLTINGRVFHQVEQGIGGCNYNHTFIIDGCLFNISYANDFYQMKINNNNFSHFLALERKKDEFQEHKVDEKSFEFTQFSKPVSQKKITMNLPGMGNGMKKKKTATVQSDNWSSFCDAGSFNPFGSSEPVEKCQTVQKQTIQKPEIVQCKTAVDNNDFNTMQDLFKTICSSKPYEEKIKVGETPTYQIQQIPTLPQINLQEFSTIQQLFATQAPVKTLNVQQNTPDFKNTQVFTPQPEKKLEDDFNTMRQLFQTLKVDSFQKITAQTEANPASISSNDFNTMQQLFATQAGVKSEVDPKKFETKQKSAFEEFHTIQCVFDTKINNKFSTFTQDLVLNSTNKLNNPKVQVKEQVTVTKQKSAQVQKPKWDDFNTMQNLFKTNVQCKKQNQFWKF